MKTEDVSNWALEIFEAHFGRILCGILAILGIALLASGGINALSTPPLDPVELKLHTLDVAVRIFFGWLLFFTCGGRHIIRFLFDGRRRPPDKG